MSAKPLFACMLDAEKGIKSCLVECTFGYPRVAEPVPKSEDFSFKSRTKTKCLI